MSVDTRENDDFVAVLLEDQDVGKPAQEHTTHRAVNLWKQPWCFSRPTGGGVNLFQKLSAEAGPLRLVPYRRFCNLVLRLRACDERTDGTALNQRSPRPRRSLPRIRAIASSHGTAEPGSR